MVDVLIGAGLGVTFVVGGGMFLYWLGWLPKEKTSYLPGGWPADLLWVGVERYRDDPIEDALEDPHTWKQYRRAKTEIVTAFDASRLPAPWACEMVRAFQGAFATASEFEAAQLREETARFRREAASQRPARWEAAEVIRHGRPQLPN